MSATTHAKQGLYDPQFEHDACGMGFVVNIDGHSSRDIVEEALQILENLDHRGAHGADEKTGDGAGITVQIPHAFFLRECSEIGIHLPAAGRYGVGCIFGQRYESGFSGQKAKLEAIVAKAGQKVLGWREVPIDPTIPGPTARRALPRITQVFIEIAEDLTDPMEVERTLYRIRREAEREIKSENKALGSGFYIASLSARTVVYKGMLSANQLRDFYLDLSDLDFQSALAMVHSRFSTNTFPSWERAHPNRYIVHNGEINAIRGNINWMKAREKVLETDYFPDLAEVFPVIDENGSDSSMFDNCLEFLYLTGRSLPEAMMIMIPEPWEKNARMPQDRKDFYAYHHYLMEPWDGPAAIAFTDGSVIGAVLDRNGLRPARYYQTKQGKIIMASEVGVVNIPPADVLAKGRLEPGKMLLIDTEKKRLIPDEEIKETVSALKPYGKMVREKLHNPKDFSLQSDLKTEIAAGDDLIRQQKMFGYTQEDVSKTILPMALDAHDPVGSMGMDIPLAVLSDKPQLLYNYFKQLFAQVTNPPIDGIREELVTSSSIILGNQGKLVSKSFEEQMESAVFLDSPLLDDETFLRLTASESIPYQVQTISFLYNLSLGPVGMQRALDRIATEAEEAIAKGCSVLVLSDRGISREAHAMPALLACSSLHQHLVRQGLRSKVGIIVETGEAREVHHFCTLVGYGATAIFPYLTLATVDHLQEQGLLAGQSKAEAREHFLKGSVKGMMKVISKMGISTMRSYQGAQIFEAVGLRQSFIDRFFTSTPSRLQGIGLTEIAEDCRRLHDQAFPETDKNPYSLSSGGVFQSVDDGEAHLYRPETVYLLQRAVRENDYSLFKEFTQKITQEGEMNLRGLLDFNNHTQSAIPLEEVEPVNSIVKRFKTGAMSYGSISQKAHETLAIAMNRLGGRSNTGEGGEDPTRFQKLPNGDSKRSSIKQVASGRFGVTIEYLTEADEIQIKMAQGAKPGEGGQLPGPKVYPKIAKVRHSTPGVGLISPPPHHDIYSIEDLAELILDLKTANPSARISVKLVAEMGVGTVAAGVAKGKADVIVISGYDGGTGAAPKTSIKHAGLPWELGLAEAHQTLIINGLRDRVVLETDGKLLTGRDVVIACLLGAEEFGFATLPLISMGCIMMRVCDLNTCPVGVATHDERLTSCFQGKPEHVENLMRFIAENMREIMATLGFHTVAEMVGRSDRLKPKDEIRGEKARRLDVSPILYQPYLESGAQRSNTSQQEHTVNQSLDARRLLQMCRPALEKGRPVYAKLAIKNTDRVVGTMLGGQLTRRHGMNGLAADTVRLSFVGSAGQSFGAFIPQGVTLSLEGDSNDYIGKGLSGGKIIVTPPAEADYAAEENIIIGNVAFYGATDGEAYINGVAGERFCVRNSGMEAVVEGVGDHGCEYMTGGKVLLLGKCGRNFAAGMSGGIAYVLDLDPELCALTSGEQFLLPEDSEELTWIREKIEKQVEYTDSPLAKRILADWAAYVGRFTKVIPDEFRRMTDAIADAEKEGFHDLEAWELAFTRNVRAS